MPLGSRRAITTRDNLSRAWLWTRTSGDAAYKLYFRGLYRAFSLCETEALASIRQRLLNDAYRPCASTKLYFPKSSGILRPVTLLGVEDQIVYQAFANVIAERLAAKVGHRYNRSVFGHQYAGKNSLFFYSDWRKSYTRYTSSMRAAYQSGHKWTVSFDLTACYDTIDHTVLTHFLRELNLNQELCRDLCVLLSHTSMVRLGGARLRALVSFCTSLSTRLVLPPLFDSNVVELFVINKGVRHAYYILKYSFSFLPQYSLWHCRCQINLYFKKLTIGERSVKALVPLLTYTSESFYC